MPRVKGGPVGHRKHRKIIAAASGFRGTRSKLYKRATEAVVRAGKHAFEGRKQRRRDFRRLWIMRINAALGPHEMRYSEFINKLSKSEVQLDRKTLAEMAVSDKTAFDKVVETVKSAKPAAK